ncbi:hypothetical protein GIB67_003024, partial [Kingdonia uniflora]
ATIIDTQRVRMDGGQKLTRTNSSLLRSSPTVRSSIHSISSIYEEDDDSDASEEEKPHGPSSTARVVTTATTTTVSGPGSKSNRFFLPVLAGSMVLTLVLFYLRREERIPTLGNFVLATIIVVLGIFVVNKRRGFVFAMKRSSLFSRKLGFSKNGSGGGGESVQWFIGNNGDSRKSLLKEENNKGVIREGVEFYSNGDFYEGEFHQGKCSGSGVYTYIVGGKYEGDWIDGRYDGYGIESWVRGSRYRGQYRQGLRHGFGVYKFYTEDSYAGEWFNGQSHGVGIQNCFDGSSYVGEFKCGVKHGLGCYQFRNGDRYAGEYFGDKIHGFGVYNFANGHCYEGSWHEGRKRGFGIYTFRSGETKCGEWDGGILKHPLPTLTDPVIRALQAARKARENALRLRQVDEQVKKTVMAANRAATAARVAAVRAVQNRINGKFCDTGV